MLAFNCPLFSSLPPTGSRRWHRLKSLREECCMPLPQSVPHSSNLSVWRIPVFFSGSTRWGCAGTPAPLFWVRRCKAFFFAQCGWLTSAITMQVGRRQAAIFCATKARTSIHSQKVTLVVWFLDAPDMDGSRPSDVASRRCRPAVEFRARAAFEGKGRT